MVIDMIRRLNIRFAGLVYHAAAAHLSVSTAYILLAMMLILLR